MFSLVARHNKNRDKEVQTGIRVYPHILENTKVSAHVISTNRTQTQISMKPDEDTQLYYSMLEYLPFQDIQQNNKKVMNLARKLRLHFSSGTAMNLDRCLLDDDGVNELFIELKERAKKRSVRELKTFVDVETQTE